MDITFASDKLRNELNDSKKLQRRYGADGAKRLRQRLDDLHAAPSLDVMRRLPGDCHELKGDRAGQLAMKVIGGYRLIFEPADVPIPRKDDGGLDWTEVTIVRILEVEDYHHG